MKNMTELDELFDALQVDEGSSIKVKFVVEGYNFWFRRQKGMVRMRRMALKLLEAQEEDPVGIEMGRYDALTSELLSRVVYQPADGTTELMDLTPENYQVFIDAVEQYDSFLAVTLDMQLAPAVAAVALGKPFLAKAMEAQEATTSSESEESSAPSEEPLTSSPTSVKTISETPAPRFRTGDQTTG